MARTNVGIREVLGREEQPFVTASDFRVLTEPTLAAAQDMTGRLTRPVSGS